MIFTEEILNAVTDGEEEKEPKEETEEVETEDGTAKDEM